MKRFYCDHCGNELSYANPAVANTNERKNTVLLAAPGTGKAPIEVTISIQVKAVTLIPQSPRHFTSDMLPVRQHADLCASCRWGLIEKLRGNTNPGEDTNFGAMRGELDWGEPTD
jgi:hypothetical protein